MSKETVVCTLDMANAELKRIHAQILGMGFESVEDFRYFAREWDLNPKERRVYNRLVKYEDLVHFAESH